ncbi:AAA family ATPase [Serratia ureilytica]|uniref:AAA family ATPase n=1 Tax=Serratia ureilytica TaxID=300181 RepID=UPI0018D8D94D|nr:AAA family ATPase [Serratia ureilytica]MBH3094667.1 AAA family ATPase [Serratia ureilytica]
MNIVSTLSVDGLWGHVSFGTDFDEKINYIIGTNGTGKTTIINLIAAVLTADHQKLDKIDFSKIEITFKNSLNQKKPRITVTKERLSLIHNEITYYFQDSAKGPKTEIPLGIIEYRDHRGNYLRQHTFKDYSDEVKLTLEKFVKVSWLSVHRYDLADKDRSNDIDPRKHFTSSIDRKLFSLSNDLVRFFSLLSQKFSEHTIEFQKKSFLSMLHQEGVESVFTFSKELDIVKERKTLSEIFEVLGVDKRLSETKLKSHFDKLGKIQDKRKEKIQGVTVNDFATLYNAWRIHSLVTEYEELQEKKKEIFKQRDIFINILNKMFSGRKSIGLSEKNELKITSKDGRNIPLEDLSSGEKQLLIILSEALVQNLESVIYIADEPELSLHIMWQEYLTDTILELNPNAQIIFATHSPDVVGSHQDKIINMEVILG